MSSNTTAVVNSITTEEEALDLMGQLRKKFGLEGIEFTRSDVQCGVEAVLHDHSDAFVAAFADPIVTAVREDRRWGRLGDQLAEHGTGILDDVAIELVGALEDGANYEHRLLVFVEGRGGDMVPVLSVGGFDDAEDAYRWGQPFLGKLVGDVRSPGDGHEVSSEGSWETGSPLALRVAGLGVAAWWDGAEVVRVVASR